MAGLRSDIVSDRLIVCVFIKYALCQAIKLIMTDVTSLITEIHVISKIDSFRPVII